MKTMEGKEERKKKEKVCKVQQRSLYLRGINYLSHAEVPPQATLLYSMLHIIAHQKSVY